MYNRIHALQGYGYGYNEYACAVFLPRLSLMWEWSSRNLLRKRNGNTNSVAGNLTSNYRYELIPFLLEGLGGLNPYFQREYPKRKGIKYYNSSFLLTYIKLTLYSSLKIIGIFLFPPYFLVGTCKNHRILN